MTDEDLVPWLLKLAFVVLGVGAIVGALMA